MLEYLEVNHGTGKSGEPDACIIWLHGLGADGYDFKPVVPELKLPASLNLRFIFPHAPVMPVTVNAGVEMRAWYDIVALSIEQAQDEAGMRCSQTLIEELVEHEIQRGIQSKRIILAGFSQGGAMSLHTGLRLAKPLAGIMCLSGYLPLIPLLTKEANPANRNTPLLIAHGRHDPIVPFNLADDSRYFLEEEGYQVEFHEYPMQHQVCPEEIEMISQWIQSVLS